MDDELTLQLMDELSTHAWEGCQRCCGLMGALQALRMAREPRLDAAV
jgi:secreted protein with Ig-like and vWFA domain